MNNLDILNQASKSEFIQLLNGVYEHSPWVAELSYTKKPFTSIEDLQQKLQQTVTNSSEEQQLQLICNHPELAGKEAEEGSLTAASQNEQKNSGLNYCSAEELQLFKKLNQQYKSLFGFPFVVAVKGLTRHDILNLMQQRLKKTKQEEFVTCIQQIGKIASFRIEGLF